MQKTQLQKKQTPRVSPKRLLGALVALIVFFFLLTSVIGLAEKHYAIKERIRELNEEQAELEEKQTELKELNKDLESPKGKEQALRNKYNLVRPGEEMIVITQPAEIKAPKVDSRPRVVRWWGSLLRGLGLKKD